MFELVICFFVSLSFLFVFRQLAKKIHLLDISDDRKQHQEAIPLIGGIAIFCTFLIAGLWLSPESPHKNTYYLIAFVLVLIGFIDDKYDLSYKIRLSVQILAALLASVLADLSISNLGFLVGDTELRLAFGLNHLVAIVAVIGAINAFNMIDGLDGLLGGLACISFAAIALSFWSNGDTALATYCFIAISCLLPFILLNLGYPFGVRFKIFMGDAGSTLIGFSIVWLLIRASQHTEASINTVTALWFIAVPLMDMAAVILRRLQQNTSPFKASRDHIHHILLNLGFSPLQSLAMILALSSLMASIGLVAEYLQLPDLWMYGAFIVCFISYCIILNRGLSLAHSKAFTMLAASFQPSTSSKSNVLMPK